MFRQGLWVKSEIPFVQMVQSFDIFQCGALVLMALSTVALLRTARRMRRTIWGEILDRALILSLGFIWLVLCGYRLFHGGLPLNIVDLLGLIAPVALATRRWQLRAILYYWGVGLCTQGLFTPMIQFGPAHLEFWFYWTARAAIFAAIGYDLFVNRYRPGWRDWIWACLATWVYIAIVLPIDLVLKANYGYLGNTDRGMRSVMLALGGWPQRVLLAGGLVVVVFLVMTLPWILLRRHPRPVHQPVAPEPDDVELIYST
jgi:hypothetical integral membrane protein (TIGR02206 family)